jgi:hypothetical protein
MGYKEVENEYKRLSHRKKIFDSFGQPLVIIGILGGIAALSGELREIISQFF